MPVGPYRLGYVPQFGGVTLPSLGRGGESTNGHAGAALGKPAVFGDDRSDWQLIAGDEILEPAGQPAIRYPRDLVGDDEQRVVSRLFDQSFEPVELSLIHISEPTRLG